MLNRSIKFLIENKLIAFILLLFLTGWGLSNAPFNWKLPWLPQNPVTVDAIPNIGENQQIVFTKWDGRSPKDIEDQITYPLTTSLMGIPGVKTIRSSSMFGFSSIYIIFEEDVEFYWSRSRILEKLNSLPANLLPEDANPSLGPDATALGQIFWYTLEGRTPDGKVTGGWNLNELRSIQDYYVKYALASAGGVSEVASIGGHVQEYQIDVEPERMRQYNVGLQEIVKAVQETNRDVGAQTLEINQAEYLLRGLGYVKSIKDIENAVIKAEDFTSLRIKDVAKVHLGPAPRRGILDKEGAEVVGGAVTARYGANPLEVINNVKAKIKQIEDGLPSKTLENGAKSQLKIVPFYDRTQLINETLDTLNEALTFEVLITVLVILIMVYHLRAAILISGMLPIAVVMVFIAMKLFDVTANIVALSGIAIAIGTMVDMAIILTENIIRHLEKNTQQKPINEVIYEASAQVSGAIFTAVLTTIISFIPVFTLTGAEGKLFNPLAFTKTAALLTALFVSLFLIPPFAAIILRKTKRKTYSRFLLPIVFLILGIIGLLKAYWLAAALIAIAIVQIVYQLGRLSAKLTNALLLGISIAGILYLLASYWRPLGIQTSTFFNFIFVAFVIAVVLLGFKLFIRYYSKLLRWTLENKLLFLSLPLGMIIIGFLIMRNTGKEFMPALQEGSFLLMPTSLPHAGVAENKRVLQQLDMAVAQIPEVKTVVGKAGRTESALDPAPLSMYENIIQYYPEYAQNQENEKQKYKVNKDGYFVLKSGQLAKDGSKKFSNKNKYAYAEVDQLIPDKNGEYYRIWRPHIKTPNDIWTAISHATKLPGITSAPKLQPIETRLIMLQTGMRAPMGIKVQGQSLEEIEAFGLELEKHLKKVKGVKKEAVFADRIVGKPYLLIDIKRDKLFRYGLSIEEVQKVIEIALGGKKLSTTVEGRERYAIRVRYPRELRDEPKDLKQVYIPVAGQEPIPLSEVAEIKYEKGPQAIKSENTFLIGYVLFDKKENYAEIDVVENAQDYLEQQIANGNLDVPNGVSYEFTGNYKNQLHAEKTLRVVIPVSLLVIFLILYLQFKSVSTTLMVFSGIAVAFSGGFIMIWLYGQDWFFNFELFGANLRNLFHIKTVYLSVAVWVGFIALFGIATDDGVVMATYLKQSFQKNKPNTKKAVKAAVIEAGKKRIRPCLMTTGTTLLALLPVLTSTGKGSDIMIPMAIPVFGGMLVALISLFVVPVLFSWLQEVKIGKTTTFKQ